ncbi:hypothetical protein [Prosthecobacter sp.]|uniref:hypothetical protein n=1 Tax=Prosthecobacter sp. TaxID=1965333 RepID=UPI002ABAACE0|nr:hypothetical protein [Prosthecobacter sp.]MDZ4402485.1 hypothetical protein [Prosthecobacter sp.]
MSTKSYTHPMPAHKNQRHITWQEAVEQGRRNRRQAATLESRNGPQQVARSAARPISQRDSTVRK